MNDGTFQWDDTKAARNYAKHGVTFEAARGVFEDVFAIEQIDDRQNYGEERSTILGMAHGRLLFVVCTMRNNSIRIIPARTAESYEEREYYEENARPDQA